ncbi:MAG: hypothetical protein QHJ82_13815 [Verrucomicrobiota bacterium]|nr:hypothetical protein [Verrucomicrobiota bacterium]
MSDAADNLWFVWRSGPMPAALNMAWDEALLEFAPLIGRPILRFYGWTEPAATFGYFQRYVSVEQMVSLRPLIRRPTGGGIVPHDRDWTYSMSIPKGHPWYNVAARPAYARIHQWLHSAFQLLGLHTRLANADTEGHGRCFAGAVRSDIMFGERKIAGAALRRTRGGFLAQGSVQPPACAPPRSEWEAAVELVGNRLLRIVWESWAPDDDLSRQACELCEQKYSQASYNRAR